MRLASPCAQPSRPHPPHTPTPHPGTMAMAAVSTRAFVGNTKGLQAQRGSVRARQGVRVQAADRTLWLPGERGAAGAGGRGSDRGGRVRGSSTLTRHPLPRPPGIAAPSHLKGSLAGGE